LLNSPSFNLEIQLINSSSFFPGEHYGKCYLQLCFEVLNYVEGLLFETNFVVYFLSLAILLHMQADT